MNLHTSKIGNPVPVSHKKNAWSWRHPSSVQNLVKIRNELRA